MHRYRASGLEFELSAFPEEDLVISEYLRCHKPALGDTVYDVGAHCGVSALELSKLVGSLGRVVCFEPDQVSFEMLLRNTDRHSLSNVICVPMAVAGRTGTAQFQMEGATGSALARHSSRGSCRAEIEVATISLADAFDRWGQPSFIKMDIEGSEVEVLDESRALLRRAAVHFVLDTNHRSPDGGMTTRAVERIFREIGYEVRSERVHGMITTWATPRMLRQGRT